MLNIVALDQRNAWSKGKKKALTRSVIDGRMACMLIGNHGQRPKDFGDPFNNPAMLDNVRIFYPADRECLTKLKLFVLETAKRKDAPPSVIKFLVLLHHGSDAKDMVLKLSAWLSTQTKTTLDSESMNDSKGTKKASKKTNRSRQNAVKKEVVEWQWKPSEKTRESTPMKNAIRL